MATKGQKQGGVPRLRRHKPSKHAMVRLNGRDHYVGAWPDDCAEAPPESKAAYDSLIARWLTNQRRPLATPEQEKRRMLHVEVAGPAPGALTVAQLAVRYCDFARGYYVHGDGSQTSEYNEMIMSLRPVVHAFGPTPAREFGPLRLKAARQLMIDGYDHPTDADVLLPT